MSSSAGQKRCCLHSEAFPLSSIYFAEHPHDHVYLQRYPTQSRSLQIGKMEEVPERMDTLKAMRRTGSLDKSFIHWLNEDVDDGRRSDYSSFGGYCPGAVALLGFGAFATGAGA